MARNCVSWLLVTALAVAVALPVESVPAPRRNLKQTTPAPQLTQRVVFDPNQGKNNKIVDYVANVYIGDVLLAQADPTAAGAGGAVRPFV